MIKKMILISFLLTVASIARAELNMDDPALVPTNEMNSVSAPPPHLANEANCFSCWLGHKGASIDLSTVLAAPRLDAEGNTIKEEGSR